LRYQRFADSCQKPRNLRQSPVFLLVEFVGSNGFNSINCNVLITSIDSTSDLGDHCAQHFLAVFDIDFNLFDDRISRQLGSLAG
jgi:hypothetical protein